MRLVHARNRTPATPDPAVIRLLADVSPERLRGYVEQLAFPRHYFAEHKANLRARDILLRIATGFGYAPLLQGTYDNIILAAPDMTAPEPFILLGAHYDSVARSPGADDNASAVALCLECARLIRQHRIGPAMIVFFNREEDGLLGSREFVAHLAGPQAQRIGEAHIFEMVGYRDTAPGSQKLPAGLPVRTPMAGDFLGLIANRGSNAIAEQLLSAAACYLPHAPVTALKTYLGTERFIGHLHRSDHAPFWKAGIPAIMWTDTSEFRNPHYHQASDTPDTLDYDFLADATRLALARVAAMRGIGHPVSEPR